MFVGAPGSTNMKGGLRATLSFNVTLRGEKRIRGASQEVVEIL